MLFTLTACPDCGTELSESNKQCQVCGCTETTDWAKFFVLANVILLIIVFSTMLMLSFQLQF